jgi:hypothetical protein
MLRPDKLLVKENVRRGLTYHMKYLEMLRSGYKMQQNRKPPSGKKTVGDTTPLQDLWEMWMDENPRRDVARQERREKAAANKKAEDERWKGKSKPNVWMLSNKKKEAEDIQWFGTPLLE